MMRAPVDRSHDKLLRLPEVLEETRLSRATIYRKIGRGEFPAPEQLSDNAVGWWQSDLARWKSAPMEWRSAA